MRNILAVGLILMLVGCASEPAGNAVDALSPAESDALNDAAEMLDQSEPPPRLTDESSNAPSPPAPSR